jgi:hypothetical protein
MLAGATPRALLCVPVPRTRVTGVTSCCANTNAVRALCMLCGASTPPGIDDICSTAEGVKMTKWAGTQIVIRGHLVRPGMRFAHRRRVVSLPDGTFHSDTCTVTAVRRGVVHYRNESGYHTTSNPSEFVNHVDHWLQEAA